MLNLSLQPIDHVSESPTKKPTNKSSTLSMPELQQKQPERFSFISKSQLELAHLGPGSYDVMGKTVQKS